MNPYDPQPPEVIDCAAVIVLREPAFQPAPRFGRTTYTLYDWFMYFDNYGSNCRLYKHDTCWGATILRVSYEDDELFARAVRAIRRLALVRFEVERDAWLERDRRENNHAPEPLPAEWDFSTNPRLHPNTVAYLTEKYRGLLRLHTGPADITVPDVVAGEMRRMYHNLALEDRGALDGADPATAWLYYHERSGELEGGARGGFFIYLDKESIERLSQVPGDNVLTIMTRDEKATLAWEMWVKIIDTTGHPDSDDESDDPVETGILEAPWARRRLRLALWFDLLKSRDDKYFLEEAGCEGENRKRRPGFDVEWTFCPENAFEFPGKDERMEEMYGPRHYPSYS